MHNCHRLIMLKFCKTKSPSLGDMMEHTDAEEKVDENMEVTQVGLGAGFLNVNRFNL